VATTADQAREALGVRLRDIRRDANLSGSELARANGWQPSKVSKIEHGKQTPSEDDLRAWCETSNALSHLNDLVAAVRSIETQFSEWRRVLQAGTRRRQESSKQVYQKARLFRIYEPQVIPGLLQTRDYAVAVLATVIEFMRIPNDVDEGADERLEQQKVLTHGDRFFHIVVGEQALKTHVGSTETMRGQLEHLLHAFTLPRVRIGIIPLKAPYRVPLNNGFWILDERLVQFDTYSAELSLIRPDEVTVYGRAFERLAALAIYGADARALVSASLEQL